MPQIFEKSFFFMFSGRTWPGIDAQRGSGHFMFPSKYLSIKMQYNTKIVDPQDFFNNPSNPPPPQPKKMMVLLAIIQVYLHEQKVLPFYLIFRCTAYEFDKVNMMCELFVISPYGFENYQTDEDKTNAIYIRENLNG
jgi:hypothetical protein